MVRTDGDAGHRDRGGQRSDVSLALLLPEVARGSRGVLPDHALDLGDLRSAADRKDVVRRVVVSMVMATRSSVFNALSLGAPLNVHITSSWPSQWNQSDATRGVPSVHVTFLTGRLGSPVRGRWARSARRSGGRDALARLDQGEHADRDPPLLSNPAPVSPAQQACAAPQCLR
jgi:hypothetical protein